MRIVTSSTGNGGKAFTRELAHAVHARPDGVPPMHLHHDVSGWTLLFALLTLAVLCNGFAIWMGWLSAH